MGMEGGGGRGMEGGGGRGMEGGGGISLVAGLFTLLTLLCLGGVTGVSPPVGGATPSSATSAMAGG